MNKKGLKMHTFAVHLPMALMEKLRRPWPSEADMIKLRGK
jgi:hypothetical protein